MPANLREFNGFCLNYLFSMVRAIRRRFRTSVIYFIFTLFVFSFITIQYSLGRPNDQMNVANSAEVDIYAESKKEGFIRRDDQKEGFIRRDDLPRPQQVFPKVDEHPVVKQEKKLDNSLPTKYVPERRIVHLDLKGAAYKPSFFPQLFDHFVKMQFTGILLEWEDMFPYTGQLAAAVNGDAYLMDDVKWILNEAKRRNLQIIPLVQTFGHLEWVLKLESFAHMREDPKYPQVICFGAEKSFALIKDMIDQVANVHKQFGMSFFHMGADEVFQVGVCKESVEQMNVQGGRERAMLWHMARVAQHTKEMHSTTVLAWHDMFAHMLPSDLDAFQLTSLLEPVLWSYAEDLDMYLPYATWLSLKPFNYVWGASAYKGADGPGRYYSNPMHYVKNHESWIIQFNRVQKEFKQVRGLIYTGWSRYDHLSVMCELVPIAFPQLAMSAETMLEAKPLMEYRRTSDWLGCKPPTSLGRFVRGCNFPGAKVYEAINDYAAKKEEVVKYLEEDYDFNGWVSKVAEVYNVSSPMYTEKVIFQLDYHYNSMKQMEHSLRSAMQPIYYQETIDEYVFTYMSDLLERLERRRDTALRIPKVKTFPKRPYIKYPVKQEL